MQIPTYAKHAMDLLENAGFECYAVGGCVRDSLLGKEPNDWDITTIALPEETKKVFTGYKVIETGIKHGTITVLVDDEPLEITTYRIDGEYLDNRHPNGVTFTRNLREDLARRDFTINAMAICLNSKNYGAVLDPFNGQKDLEQMIIRTPLNPDITFSDDPLRMMRCIRFATQLEFYIEQDTYDAISRNAERLDIISKERIVQELDKIMMSSRPSTGLIMLEETGLLKRFLPEISNMKGVETIAGKGHKDIGDYQ